MIAVVVAKIVPEPTPLLKKSERLNGDVQACQRGCELCEQCVVLRRGSEPLLYGPTYSGLYASFPQWKLTVGVHVLLW